ncbi:hypothetical protein NBRC116601_11330 [Cognatishimia sp. WU-CL00825]
MAGISVVLLQEFATSLSVLWLQVFLGAGLFVSGLHVARSGRKEGPCDLHFDPSFGEFYLQAPGEGPATVHSAMLGAFDCLSLKPFLGRLHLDNQRVDRQAVGAVRLHVSAKNSNRLAESYMRYYSEKMIRK